MVSQQSPKLLFQVRILTSLQKEKRCQANSPGGCTCDFKKLALRKPGGEKLVDLFKIVYRPIPKNIPGGSVYMNVETSKILRQLNFLSRLVEGYRPFLRDEFHGDKARKLRAQIQNVYYSIEDKIMEALGGLPTQYLFGKSYPVFETAFSEVNSTAAFHTIKGVPQLLTKVSAYYKKDESKSSDTQKNNSEPYIHDDVTRDIPLINKRGFSDKKLKSLVTELNDAHQRNKPYSTLSLIRAIMDHIPPLLAYNSFEEAANHYTWSTTNDKKFALALQNDKNIPHEALHGQITDKDDMITMQAIPNPLYLNRVLRECMSGTIDYTSFKSTQAKQKQQSSHQLSTQKTLSSPIPLITVQFHGSSGGPDGYRLELLLENVGDALANVDELMLGSRTVDASHYPPLKPNVGTIKLALHYSSPTETKSIRENPRVFIKFHNPITGEKYISSYTAILEGNENYTKVRGFRDLKVEADS